MNIVVCNSYSTVYLYSPAKAYLRAKPEATHWRKIHS